MPTVRVTLEPQEREALSRLARRERRDPRAQAALLIRRELERLGLLTVEAQEQSASKPAEITAQA